MCYCRYELFFCRYGRVILTCVVPVFGVDFCIQLAWATIAFLVLTITIIWYTLEYCSTIQLPGNVETVIFSWLTIWWVSCVDSSSRCVTIHCDGLRIDILPILTCCDLWSWCFPSQFVGSIVLTATRASDAPAPSTVPVVFAWMLAILSGFSAFIGSRGPKQVEYRMSETEGEESGYSSRAY